MGGKSGPKFKQTTQSYYEFRMIIVLCLYGWLPVALYQVGHAPS